MSVNEHLKNELAEKVLTAFSWPAPDTVEFTLADEGCDVPALPAFIAEQLAQLFEGTVHVFQCVKTEFAGHGFGTIYACHVGPADAKIGPTEGCD